MSRDPVYPWMDKSGIRTMVSRSGVEIRVCFSVCIWDCRFRAYHQVCGWVQFHWESGRAHACHSKSSDGQAWIQSMADSGETDSQFCFRGMNPCGYHWGSGRKRPYLHIDGAGYAVRWVSADMHWGLGKKHVHLVSGWVWRQHHCWEVLELRQRHSSGSWAVSWATTQWMPVASSPWFVTTKMSPEGAKDPWGIEWTQMRWWGNFSIEEGWGNCIWSDSQEFDLGSNS